MKEKIETKHEKPRVGKTFREEDTHFIEQSGEIKKFSELTPGSIFSIPNNPENEKYIKLNRPFHTKSGEIVNALTIDGSAGFIGNPESFEKERVLLEYESLQGIYQALLNSEKEKN